MEKKCSSDKHKDSNANNYCPECKIYMCKICEEFHSKLFNNHHQYKINNNNYNVFTGLCKIKNHSMKLEYFCKTHIKLCCAACLCNIKGNGNGRHKNCEVRKINALKKEKEEMINMIHDIIDSSEDYSNDLDQFLNEIKSLYEKQENKKEELKIKIQKIFTELRTIINDREDKLLLEVDKKYNKILINYNIIKKSEKLTEKLKESLEKGKLININDWNDETKFISVLNDSINILKNMDDIQLINDNIKKYESNKDIKIIFDDRNELEDLKEVLERFGSIEVLK